MLKVVVTLSLIGFFSGCKIAPKSAQDTAAQALADPDASKRKKSVNDELSAYRFDPVLAQNIVKSYALQSKATSSNSLETMMNVFNHNAVFTRQQSEKWFPPGSPSMESAKAFLDWVTNSTDKLIFSRLRQVKVSRDGLNLNTAPAGFVVVYAANTCGVSASGHIEVIVTTGKTACSGQEPAASQYALLVPVAK